MYFALMNSQVIKALSYLGYDKLPHYNYQYTGKNYIKVCDIVKELKNELIKVGIECENLLAVDYFLWEVADHAVETKPPTTRLPKRLSHRRASQRFPHSSPIP